MKQVHCKSIQITMDHSQFQRVTGVSSLACSQVKLRLQYAFFQFTQCGYTFVVRVKTNSLITGLQYFRVFTHITVITSLSQIRLCTYITFTIVFNDTV